MRKKKILCCVIPTLQAGGMERVMSELIWHFVKKNNLIIHLILYGKTREIFYNIPKEIILHKPEFEFNDNRRFISTLKTLIFLRKKIKDIKPDSILSFGEYWNNFVLLAMYGLDYPVFVSDRSQPDKSLGKLHDNLRNWLYPKAAGIIAQTRKAKEIYKTYYNHANMVVIGNPVRQIYDPESGIKRENFVLNVGRLIRSKHQDELIRLFAKINEKGWKLIIIGYDHLKQKNMDRLKLLIKDLNAEETIILAGKQNDVDKFYLQSKIFAFASSSEGFPNVIAEAMSAGLPVVSFDCVAGPSEMIENGENGFLVPLFDYDQFKDKLNLLMTDEPLRDKLGDKARRSVKKYSPEIISEEYFNFILNENI